MRGALSAPCVWLSLSTSILGQVLEGEEKRNTIHSWNPKQKKTNKTLVVGSKLKMSKNIYDPRLLVLMLEFSSFRF